jgi:hypothetical protein
MSPQETVNQIASLKKRGAFENADIKQLIEAKLERAKTDGRVSAFKAKVAVEASGATGELAAQLDAITEAQVKSRGSISRPTALFIDKSGSMDVAIEVGKQLGAMISSICEQDLFVYAFDTMAHPIEITGNTLVDWERALHGIRAMGATSCGAPLAWMEKKKQRVEQIVMISDERENNAPRWKEALQKYQENVSKVDVVFVKVGNAGDSLERDCESLGVTFRAFDFGGDYYALTNLAPVSDAPVDVGTFDGNSGVPVADARCGEVMQHDGWRIRFAQTHHLGINSLSSSYFSFVEYSTNPSWCNPIDAITLF